MLCPDTFQMTRHYRTHNGRQQRDSILIAFCASYQNLIGSKVHIFDTELKTFEQPQAGTIQQRCHQPICSAQLIQYLLDFIASPNNRQPLRPLFPNEVTQPGNLLIQYVSIQEQNRTQGLILHRSANVSIHGKRREETRNLLCSHFGRMPLPVKDNEPAYPSQISLFCPATIMKHRKNERGFPSLADPGSQERCHGIADSGPSGMPSSGWIHWPMNLARIEVHVHILHRMSQTSRPRNIKNVRMKDERKGFSGGSPCLVL